MGDNYSLQTDICVLIPCFNNSEGLIRSIKSIAYHTKGLHLLVVDDGSAVAISEQELELHLPVTITLHLIRLPENKGIIKALNAGLDFINKHYQVTFIARLDCGDTCHATKFTKQVSFLTNHPTIDLLGTWCYFKEHGSGVSYKYTTPTRHKAIEKSMSLRNVFVHPTVMWRVSALPAIRYPEKYPHAEDYGLFYDILLKKQTAILDEFLVVCEINPNGISSRNRKAQLRSRLKVICDFGTLNIWLVAGICKLIALLLLPYSFIYRVKKTIFKPNPERG